MFYNVLYFFWTVLLHDLLLSMNEKTKNSISIKIRLYDLLSKEENKQHGVQENELIKIIYGKKPSISDQNIKRQIDRYREKIKEKWNCDIVKANRLYKLIDSRKSKAKNSHIKKVDTISKCIFKSINDYKILKLDNYISRKGENTYFIIAMELNAKGSYFKAYSIDKINYPDSIFLKLKDKNLKRFKVSNCSYVPTIDKNNFLKVILDKDLEDRLLTYSKLENDNFGFKIEQDTRIQTITFSYTSYFKKYLDEFLSTKKDVEIKEYKISRKKNVINSPNFKYETTIRFGNIKHFLLLILPHLDQIHFNTKADIASLKKQSINYIKMHIK